MENAPSVKPEPAEAAEEEQVPRAPSSADTERPPSGQHPQEETHDDESDDEVDNTEPGDKVQAKDWEELEHRYHDMIKKCQGQEEQLAREFDSLMAFFKVWSEAGAQQETNRTYARLKTRMTHVQHSEAELEGKREHYTAVVNAFKSALDLLRQYKK